MLSTFRKVTVETLTGQWSLFTSDNSNKLVGYHVASYISNKAAANISVCNTHKLFSNVGGKHC